jgi:hypothetical protein
MATKKTSKKPGTSAKSDRPAANLTQAKHREVMKDLREVLTRHGLPNRIDALTLTGNVGGLCDCGGGKIGHLILVPQGNRQVLVCDCG